MNNQPNASKLIPTANINKKPSIETYEVIPTANINEKPSIETDEVIPTANIDEKPSIETGEKRKKKFYNELYKLPKNKDGSVTATELIAKFVKAKNESLCKFEDLSQIQYNMVKPIMPYNHWLPNLFPISDSESLKRMVIRQHESMEPPSRDWTYLNHHLLSLSTSCANQPSSLTDKDLKLKMENLFSKIVSSLKNSLILFYGCKLHYTGSVYEGLKIGEQNEFDFMIEVPALEKIVSFNDEGKAKRHKLQLILEDVNILNDIPVKINIDVIKGTASLSGGYRNQLEILCSRLISDMNSISPTNLGEESNSVGPQVIFAIALRSLAILIEEKISKQMPSNWELIPTESLRKQVNISQLLYEHKSAFYYQFVVDGKEISVDLALAIPIRNLALLSKSDSLKDSLPSNFEEIVESRNTVHHAIIRTSGTCRITFSFIEKEIMNQYQNNDIRKVCLRLMKYFRDEATIHQKFATKSPSPVLNTYHIKTIFYFIFDKYDKASEWTFDTLAPRLLESIASLKRCFEENILESYFIPWYNVLKGLSFIEEHSTSFNDIKLLKQELQTLYEVISDANNENGYRRITQFISNTNSIREISGEEEIKRKNNAFIFLNLQ